MPKYDRTRNRKRKKTKQINKRTRKQPVRGKKERNYKRSRQLGGMFGWGPASASASEEGVKINGLEGIVFSSVSSVIGSKSISMKKGGNNLERLFLDKEPISHLEDWLMANEVNNRKTLAVASSLSTLQEVKLNLTGDGVVSVGKPSVLLWPYLKSQITVRCKNPGEDIVSLNDCRKAHLRKVVLNISEGKSPDEALETQQSSTTGPYSRPSSVAATNTIQISDEDKIQKLIDHLSKNYGVILSQDKIKSGGAIDVDKLMQELGISEKPTYRYGHETLSCKLCPGMYDYYVISATDSADTFTFDQVARVLYEMVKDADEKYFEAVESIKQLNLAQPAPVPGPPPQPAAPAQSDTPSFKIKTDSDKNAIKNCELCNNPISDSRVDPRKMTLWKRRTCVHCDYVVCKACCDQKTCNRCDLRMLTE